MASSPRFIGDPLRLEKNPVNRNAAPTVTRISAAKIPMIFKYVVAVVSFLTAAPVIAALSIVLIFLSCFFEPLL